MKYQVDEGNNFCRVFELPKEYPRDFCFGGGHAVNFQLVDWFNPVREITEVEHDTLLADLIPFLQTKNYLKKDRTYLILCDFGAAFTFTAPEKLEAA